MKKRATARRKPSAAAQVTFAAVDSIGVTFHVQSAFHPPMDHLNGLLAEVRAHCALPPLDHWIGDNDANTVRAVLDVPLTEELAETAQQYIADAIRRQGT